MAITLTPREQLAHDIQTLEAELAAARKAKRATKDLVAQLAAKNTEFDALPAEPVVEVIPPAKKISGPKPSTLALVEQRRPSWSTLSTEFPQGVTAVEALEQAGIEDLIIKAPMYAQLPDGDFVEVAGKFAMVNPRTGKFYGPASGEYNFLQNREVAEMLDEYITTQFPVIAAGNTPDGSGVMFILDAGERPVGGEAIHQYFVVAESRTVGVSFKSAFTPVRFACMNTLMTAFRRAFTSMNARHDRNFKVSVADSMAFVAYARLQAQQTMLLMDRMAQTPISAENLLEMARLAFPLPSRDNLSALEMAFGDSPKDEYAEVKLSKAVKAYNYWSSRAEAMQNLAIQRFEDFGSQTDQPQLLGTVYAAYNAVTEVADHGLFKGSNAPTVANDSLFGPRADGKVRAMTFAEQLLLA